jgi:hypothetical protein
MARFSILVREHGSDHDVLLMEVNSNPNAIVAGLRAKSLTLKRTVFEAGKRHVKIPKYSYVRVIDHGEEERHGGDEG